MNTPTTLTWLHLSDTHIGNPKFDPGSNNQFKALIDDLICARDRYDLNPDLIFFTGDLAYGQIDRKLLMKGQYTKFYQLLDQIRNVFEPPIPKKAVFLVPGNHDVNRKKIGGDQSKWLLDCKQPSIISTLMAKHNTQWGRYMERLEYYRKSLDKQGYPHLLEDRHRLCFSREIKMGDIIISISGINTVWSSSGDREKGRLWLGLWQLEEAIKKSRNADLKILLCHHPPNWLNEFEDNRANRLIELNFDFMLHGHEHKDWVIRLENHIRISGGTCYQAPEGESGYNITQIHFRENRVRIHLRSFDATGGGWIPKILYNKTSQDGIWTLNNLPLIVEREKGHIDGFPKSQVITTKKQKGIDIYRYFTVAKAQEDESLFVGRREELARGIGALKAPGASIPIYGKAGVGKSSLAIQLGYIATGGHNKLLNSLKRDYDELPQEALNYPVAYYSCREYADETIPDMFVSVMLDKAGSLSFGGLLDKEKVKKELRKSSNEVTLRQLKKIEDFGRTPETLNIAVQLFTNVAYIISKLWSGLPLVLILDEYDVVKNKTGLATHIKSNPFIKYILSGTANDVFILVKEHESIPRQIAEGQILVNKMDDEECVEIVKKEIARSRGQFTFSDRAVKQLAESARGMPFFVHFFGRYAIAEAIRRTKGEYRRPLIISDSDVSSAMVKRLKDLATLDAQYLELTKGNWKKEVILNLLAFRASDTFNMRDIYYVADQLGINKQQCTSYARALEKKGIISRAGALHYEFLDTRTKVFARLRKPLTPDAKKRLRHFFFQNKMRENVGGWMLPPHFEKIKTD